MKYTKPALSFEQQAQRLLDRGMIAPDKNMLVKRLSMVNYYRLSAYWYPFKQIDANTRKEYFKPNTSLETIWRRYTFDRQLRFLVMEAVEQVEVTILRTRMVEQFTLLHGPFGYRDIANFNPKFRSKTHARWIEEVSTAVKRSSEDFVRRFQHKYAEESYLPLWMAVEVMTFGQLFTMFRHLHRSEQQKMSREFDLYPPVLVSWLHTLNFIRNTCAHHARLWNRELAIRPRLPDTRHQPEWHLPEKLDNRRVFAVLTLLQHLLTYIDPQNDWSTRLEQLLVEYPELPLGKMGFPKNWRSSPIWKINRK